MEKSMGMENTTMRITAYMRENGSMEHRKEMG